MTAHDRARIEEHKANMRRMRPWHHGYCIGWIEGELKHNFTPSRQIHSIRLVIEAYSELEKEPLT